MRLFSMRTFPASENWESCLGPVFRTLTDSDQDSFSIFLYHIGDPTFSWQNKVIKVCPKYLLTSFQNWSAQHQRQINVDQSKLNDVHNYPGYEYDSGRVSTICMVI